MRNLVELAEVLQDSTLTLDGIEGALMRLSDSAREKDDAMFYWLASCIGEISDDIEDVAEGILIYVEQKSKENTPA